MHTPPTICVLSLIILSLCDVWRTFAKDDPHCPSGCSCYPWPPRIRPVKIEANCSGLALKTLPSPFQYHIASLEASFNEIEVLSKDFFGDTRLKLSKINLSNNSIHSIDNKAFTVLPELWIMNLTGNKIQYLHHDTFKVNSKLWYLILRGNSIKFNNHSIFLNAPQIGKLDLSYNNLHELRESSFTQMPNIVYLRLHNNQFKKLHSSWFRPLRKLERLFLEHNQLTTLDMDTFIYSPKLFELSLSWNKLILPSHSSFLRLPNVEYLHLSGCDFGNLPTHMFEFTPRIRMLWLSSNRLSSLSTDIFNYLESLIFLNACGNTLLCSCELKEVWEICRDRHVAADVSCTFTPSDGMSEVEEAPKATVGNCPGHWDVLEDMVCNATAGEQLEVTSKETSVVQLAIYVTIGVTLVVLLLGLLVSGILYYRKYKTGWTRNITTTHNITYPDMMPLNANREETT